MKDQVFPKNVGKTTILPLRGGKTKEKQPKQLFAKLKQERTKGSSSEKEHKVNALASGAEEGRDKLR